MKLFLAHQFCLFALCVPICSPAANIKKLAKAEWLEVSSQNFNVITDVDEELARVFVRDLEYFRLFLSHILQISNLKDVPPLYVLAVSKNSHYRALGAPEDVAGFFQMRSDRSIAVAFLERYRRKTEQLSFSRHVLMHEYVHYATSNVLEYKNHPPWYREGIADYLGTFRVKDGEIDIGRLDAIRWRFHALEAE